MAFLASCIALSSSFWSVSPLLSALIISLTFCCLSCATTSASSKPFLAFSPCCLASFLPFMMSSPSSPCSALSCFSASRLALFAVFLISCRVYLPLFGAVKIPATKPAAAPTSAPIASFLPVLLLSLSFPIVTPLRNTLARILVSIFILF